MNAEMSLLHLLLAYSYMVCNQIVHDFVMKEVEMVEPLHDEQGYCHLESVRVSLRLSSGSPSIELEFTALEQTCNR